MARPVRKHPRLRGFDYSKTGAYLVTICCAGRKSTFGQIKGGVVEHSHLGKLVVEELSALSSRYDAVEIDCFVVMPNHLHFVVWLGAGPAHGRSPVPQVSIIVAAFKAGVTRRAGRELRVTVPVWQPRYHEHVIRHEVALARIREYIVNNPLQWSLDHENPECIGADEFQRWLQAYVKQLGRPEIRTP